FPKDELERLRQQRLTSLLQGRDDPSTIASATFSRVIFGVEHRYGTPTSGSAETIKAFTTDDLHAFYTSAFRPEKSTVIVVGDIKADTVLPLLEKQFGSWKAAAGAAPPVKVPPVPADELSRAKNYISLRYTRTFETTSDIPRRLEDALIYKLPADYFEKYVQSIQSVTPAGVQRVAQKYLIPDRFAVDVVGDE